MEANNPRFSIVNVISKTARQKSIIEDTIDIAFKLKSDPEQDIREEKQLCKYCHYHGFMAGNALTKCLCALCDKELVHGNTNIDNLCKECAKENKLCKHCGCDINLNPNRKKWPSPKSEIK